MKTPKEIKKAMDCCKAGDCMSCPYLSNDNTLPCNVVLSRDVFKYIQQLEDHIRGLTKMVPRWISVGERLPENGALVVVLCRYDFAPNRYYLLHERYDLRSNFWHDGSAQYWMPLPELPEVEIADN